MVPTTVAIDLAKDVFQVAVANRAGRIVDRHRFTRRQFERFIDTLVAESEVIMESCGTSHYGGGECGHAACEYSFCPCSTRGRTPGATRRIARIPTRCSRAAR